jgi:hypothetical protein
MSASEQRETYIIALRPEPRVDGIRALRALAEVQRRKPKAV